MNSVLKAKLAAILMAVFMCANIAFAQTITSFSPAIVCPGATVTIKGTAFTKATAVKFGGVNAASFTINSATTITAIAGAGANGVITVTTPAGTATSSNTISIGGSYNAYAYITNSNAGTVSVINTANNAIATTVTVGTTPIGVAVTQDGAKAYIANNGSNNVSVINTAGNAVAATINVGTAPVGLVANADGSRVYVANQASNTISVINTATNTVITTLNIGTTPTGMALSADGSKLFVTNFTANTVQVFNTSNNSFAATITTGTNPFGIAASPDGSKIYVCNSGAATVTVYSATAYNLLSTINTGTVPYSLAITPNSSTIYVACHGSNIVNVIDAVSNTLTTSLVVGNLPTGISLTPDGSKAYVTNIGSNTASIINTATNTVTTSVAAGNSPYAFGNFIANVYIPCPPTIASFTPSSTCPGTAVTITGTNFTNVLSVKFGGTKAASFTVNSSTNITATPGPGATGPISVTTTGGTGTSTGTFTVQACPVITSFTPAFGCPGTAVTITGYNLARVTAVKFGGVNAASFTINSGTSITAFTGTGSTGPISATTPVATTTSDDIFAFGTANFNAYIPNQGSGYVSVINTATNVVDKTIAVGSSPVAVAANPADLRVYIANFSSNTVSVISTITNTVVATVAVALGPYALAVSPDDSVVYVANQTSGSVSVIKTATNTVVANIATGSGPSGIVVSPDGSKVYVSNNNDGTISVINAQTNAVTSTITGLTNCLSIAISPDGGKIYSGGFNGVTVINASSNTITGYVVNNNVRVYSLAVSPDGSKLYTANNAANNVSVINTATNAIVTTISVGTGPYGISVTPDGGKVYVSNTSSTTVSVINTATNTISATVSVGASPRALGNFIATAVVSCAPAITSFAPASGCPGISVTIKGSSFIGVTAVKFGGTNAASFQVNADSSITAIPAAGTATGPITVTTNVNTTTSITDFTILTACASITSFTPTLLNCSGGTVTITGQNLNGVTAVSFGGVNAASFTVNSATSLTATAGADAPLYGTITVTKPTGPATSSGSFTKGALSGFAYAYITNYQKNTVSVISKGTNTVIATIPVGSNPTAVAVPAAGNYVYVTNSGSNTVSVINTAISIVTANIPVGATPGGIAISPGGNRLYVVNSGNNNISVINTASNTVVATIAVGASPYAIAVSPDGHQVYVTNIAGNSVSIINADNNIVTSTVPVANNPYGIAVSADGAYLYVANYGNNTLSIISTATNTVTAVVPAGTNPYGVAVSPVTGQVYVTNYVSSNISIVNTVTSTVTATILSGGAQPKGISFSADGSEFFVINYNSNLVSVFNAFNNTLVASVTVGTAPSSFGVFINKVSIPCTPTITSFTPLAGCTGNTVTITGTNFTNASAVKFGNTDAAYFTVVSPTTITAVIGKGNPGAVSVITPGGTGTSTALIKTGGVPSFTISPSPVYLSNGSPRLLTTSLPGAYKLSCTNGQVDTSVIKISAPGTYIVTAKDSVGCTSTTPITAFNYSGGDGYLEVVADPFVNYFDTIHVRVNIRNGVNIYSAFAYLNFDNSRLQFLDAAPGSYFGTGIINTSPYVNGNTINFGITKKGAAGSSGDGVLYDFRFILSNLPTNVAFDSLNPNSSVTGFGLTKVTVYNTARVQPKSFTDISLLNDSTYCRYYVPVWPGDLNNDKKVDVSDILPIGYFAFRTGSIRPNASLLWKAQPAILWGFDKTNINGTAFETFADANADGIIDLADQTPIGFNLSNTHSLVAAPYKTPVLNFLPTVPAIYPDMHNTVIRRGALPHTEVVKVLAGNNTLPIKKLYGVAFDIYFDPSFVNIAGITTDYTGSKFGIEGVSFIKIEDRSALASGRLSIGITRYNSTFINGNGKLILKVNLPLLSGAPNGKFKVMVNPISANDNKGFKLNVTGSADSLTIGSSTGVVAITSFSAVADSIPGNLPGGKFYGVIFPNPAGSTAKLLTSGAKGKVLVTITDLTGKAITKMEINGNTTTVLPVSSLAAGVYIVTISDGKQSKALKLVKMQ